MHIPLLLLLLTAGEPAATGRAFRESAGRVGIEAEHPTAAKEPACWKLVDGVSGKAVKVMEGPWPRHLRYDVRFETPGTYRLWALARKNPTAAQYQGNDAKVFFYAAGSEQAIHPKAVAFEIGMKEQLEFRWLDWAKNSPTNTTDLRVDKPGRYSLYLVGGANEEWGWEVDKLVLTRDNAAPPAGADPGAKETIEASE